MDFLSNDDSSWAWPGFDLCLQTDSKIVTGYTRIAEDISFIFEETTPTKSCGDFAYPFDDCEIASKTSQGGKEYSSQNKRRRVLNFSNDDEDISSSFFKSKERLDAHDLGLPEIDAYLQDVSLPTIEDFIQSEAWLSECLNDTELTLSSDDGNASSTSDVQIGTKEVCTVTPDSGSSTVQHPVKSSRRVVFKGQKSYMRTPSKVPSTVAYPFDFIKPSGVHGGGVTLKDINQRIHTPPPSKPEEDITYPTSAFSGKPVVGKTKIPTRGNGSITIMRTKG